MTHPPGAGSIDGQTGLTPGLLIAGRYQVVELLAFGGMSTVYRGFDLRLRRPVAVKVMSPRLSADPSFVRRFEREARATASLSHSGLVSVHDHGTDGQLVFLVMELVEGGTLRDLLRQNGSLSIPQAFAVLSAVVQPLAQAHGAGLIHRDIKPENILVSSTGVVKLADFGLVRTVFTQTLATGNGILGTVPYMAPEQIATGTADTRTDVYALGVVAFEMLTGSPPFSGDNPIAVAYQHVHSDVPALSSSMIAVPPALDDFLRSITSRNPDQRPRDAGELLVLLQKTALELDVPLVAVTPPAVKKPQGKGTRSVQVQSEPTATRRALDGHLTAQQPPAAPTRYAGPNPSLGGNSLPIGNPPATRTRGRLIATLVFIATLGSAGLVASIVYAQNQSTQSASTAEQPPTSSRSSPSTTPIVPSPATTTPPPTTVRETVTTTAVPSTSTPRSRSQPSSIPEQDTPVVDDGWSEGPNLVRDGTPPDFPATLKGWRLQNEWDLTERAFDTTWTDIAGADYTDFPSTSNGCDEQRFLVRWRVLDDGATVHALWADAANSGHEQVTAQAGWFDLDGCEHPAIMLAESTNGSTLADVAVSVQQYWPAV